MISGGLRFPVLLAAIGGQFLAGSLWAQVVYSAAFQSGVPAEFSYSGVLPGLGTTSLPTDGAGMASANQSMWLGRLGDGISENAGDQVVTLTLNSLTPGTTYHVAFDLLIGASWDGNAGTYGPDEWRLRADGTILVDTLFSDSNGSNMGAYSPPSYSDSTFTNPNSGAQPYFSGAEFYNISGNTNYSNDYAVYYFGHGAGNPQLTFVASSSTALLEFARLAMTNSGVGSDEYWAIDNVTVTAVPEPSEFAALLGIAGLTLAGWRRRRNA